MNAAGGHTVAPLDVEQAAAFVAATSERTIRAQVEAVRRGRTAAYRQLFHDLAYDVSAGHVTREVGHHSARRLATGCSEPTLAFDRLVEAVRDLTAYTASREAEGEWLVSHHIKPNEETRETYLGVIHERIEHALDELLVRVAA